MDIVAEEVENVDLRSISIEKVCLWINILNLMQVYLIYSFYFDGNCLFRIVIRARKLELRADPCWQRRMSALYLRLIFLCAFPLYQLKLDIDHTIAGLVKLYTTKVSQVLLIMIVGLLVL